MADQGSEGLFSPFLRHWRFAAVRPLLRGAVLDVGCGSGLLAGTITASRYHGVDVDAASLALARQRFPEHRFSDDLGAVVRPGGFQTVVSLAVIEHVPHPGEFMAALADQLAPEPAARVVITTPHPSLDWAHDLGARLGLFSSHANEEHEELLDRSLLQQAGLAAGLALTSYRRFLLGANQLAVFVRRC